MSATMLFLSACGGGNGDSGDAGATVTGSAGSGDSGYAVGGTVTGLASGASLQLQNNGSDTANISANGTFTFSRKLPSGTSYAASVKTQPTGQFCNVAKGAGTVSPANVTTVSVVCAKILDGGSGALPASGGIVTTAAADVDAPEGASLTTQNVTVSSVAPPPGLPAAFTAVGAAVDVALDHPASLNAPFKITVRYDSSVVPDEDALAVVHYNSTTHKYEPVTILNQDKTAHAFTFDSRVFSPFVVVAVDLKAIPASHNVTNFDVSKHGWNIKNFGTYYSDGQCLGMSAYATWYFANGTDNLNGKYSTSGVPSIAQLVAMRAQLAQSQYWAAQSSTYLSTLGNAETARLMRVYLAAFDQPLVLLLGVKNGEPLHASVLYGYDSAGFKFYDVNEVNSAETLTFDGLQWGTYGEYGSFSYVAMPSLGRTEDFAELTAEAVGGFTSSDQITVTSPTPSQQINGTSANLTGTLSSLNSNESLIAWVNGNAKQIVAKSPGAFNATVPISDGDNTIVLFAGVDIEKQSDWLPNAATLILHVTGVLEGCCL
jgi:hypothetical protein